MKSNSLYWDDDKNIMSRDTKCSMIHGVSSIQELNSNKFLALRTKLWQVSCILN